MKKKGANIALKIAAIFVVVFGIIFGVITLTQTPKEKTDRGNPDAAIRKLDDLYKKLRVNHIAPKKDASIIQYDDSQDGAVLPDISQYPFVVNPATDDFLTVYASPEKAGSAAMGWLRELAEQFNQSGMTIDGNPVSVGVRAVPSDIGAAFIYTGKYTPDLFMPSSSIWGDMALSRGAKVEQIKDRLAGNVAGVVLSNKKMDELRKTNANPDGAAIVNGILNGDLIIGYADALSSTEGLNFVMTALHTFDPSNPNGDTASAQLKQFQDHVPYVAYDASQLKASTVSGGLDGFVWDYQAFVNAPELKSSYTFIPFGVRHDQPVYAVGEQSALKQQIAAAFVDYCLTPQAQQSATDKGFNGLDDYVPAVPVPDGAVIVQSQETWKKEKNGTRDLTAVFVADVSGSMEGSPLLKLKASLNRAASVIGVNTNVGFVTFSDEVNIALPIAKFDQDQKAYFLNAVKSLWAGGATAMFDSIVVAEKMLVDAQQQNPNTKLILFVLTDGETNRGYSFDDIKGITMDLRIPIYTIGYNADIDVLKQISDINEATTMNAETDNVIFKLESLFNAQM